MTKKAKDLNEVAFQKSVGDALQAIGRARDMLARLEDETKKKTYGIRELMRAETALTEVYLNAGKIS